MNLKAGLIIHTFKLKICLLECLPYFCMYKKLYVCNVLRPCSTWEMGNIHYTCAHITLTTFSRFAQNSAMRGMLALWLYHTCSYTVGLKKPINLPPLFADIWTTFFAQCVACLKKSIFLSYLNSYPTVK